MTDSYERIRSAFGAGKPGYKAFIPYLVAGDPDIRASMEIIRAAVTGGADMIEIGIPFSDPTAEGPVIQDASARALEAGTTTDKVFQMVRCLRAGREFVEAGAEPGASQAHPASQNTEASASDRPEGLAPKQADATDGARLAPVNVPLCVMTYANVVFSYGTRRFMQACADAGIDALILPDVPLEERDEFARVSDEFGIGLVPLVAPTSADRIADIARAATGWVYVVSSLGVTGMRSHITTDLGAITDVVRRNCDLPCAIGFGVSTPEQAAHSAQFADGVIVGSAIVNLVARHGADAPRHVEDFVRQMVAAIR